MCVRKKLALAVIGFCAALCALFCGISGGAVITARASNSSNGTNTDGEWNGSQTTNNLIYVSDGTATQSAKSLADYGWQNVSDNGNIYPYSRHYTNSEVDLKSSSYGWGIQSTTGNDIGNSSYNGGVWYRITLSEADRVKAAKGDLTVSAASVNFCQTAARAHISLKLFFDNDSGEQIDAKEVTENVGSSAYALSINNYSVPANTASIRYYVSNHGSLTARPYIGGLVCTLSDATAPKAESVTVTAADGGSAPAYAVPGVNFCYSLSFDEKVSVTQSGTATVVLNGTEYTDTKASVVQTADGKTQINYAFAIPQSGGGIDSDGSIVLRSISGLSAVDEAGNTLDAGSVTTAVSGAQALTFYGLKNVTSDLSGLTFSGQSTAVYGTNYTATLTADTGYSLPQSVTVSVGGSVTGSGYTYNSVDGSLTLNGDIITGDILITAAGVPKQYTVTFDKAGGSGGVDSATATYDSALPQVTAPTRTGYTFGGYYTAQNGGGTQYYGANGESVAEKYTVDGGLTLYAQWTANKYTVNYNANKPAGASSEVFGSTVSSSHTYNIAGALTTNAFTLTGWTFKGWAAESGGSVLYADGGTVVNLTAEADGAVTLYAVWEADVYTITLNAAGGSNSGSVGATFDSTLTDIPAIPARHGYSFNGYFDAVTGGTQYYGADGKAFENKTFATEGNVVLYAQWSPVTYTVELYSEGNYIGSISDVVFGVLSLPSAQSLGLARSNYDFVGWNMYDEQSWAMYRAETVYAIGLTGGQDDVVVLYAAWEEKPLHTLLYDANGGTGAPVLLQIHEEETVILSADIPTRADYTFLGWATSAASGTAEYESGGEFTMGDGPITLYAVWKHNNSLTYDAGGGSFTGEIGAVYPASGESVTLTAVQPVRAGYVFLGWAVNGGAEEAEYESGGAFVMPSGDTDVILYAVWEAEKYTVTASAADGYEIAGLLTEYTYGETASFTVTGDVPKVYINGGQASPQDGQYSFTVTGNAVVTVTDGTKLALVYDADGGADAPTDVGEYEPGGTAAVSAEAPVRTGYTFLGWATESGAEQAEYTAGEHITFGETDVVLYAVWRAHTYYVSYVACGGEGEMKDSGHVYGAASALAENAFTFAGHTFLGWAESENGAVIYGDGAQVSDLTAVDKQTVTLYAVWEKTVSLVRLDAEGGTGEGSFYAEFGAQPAISALNAPVRAGYRFLGYYTQTDGGGAQIFDCSMNFVPESWNINERSVTLFADWSPIVYSIVYINGSAAAGEPQSVEYGVPFALKTLDELGIAVPVNMYFAGWATYPGSAAAVYTDGQPIEYGLSQTEGAQIYLYTVFAENPKWNVTYDANGGDGVPVDLNAYYEGEEVYFPSAVPERYGYIFLGWSGSPRDGAADYPYGEGGFTTESFTMTGGDVTLYAVWQAGDTLQAQIERLDGALSALDSAVSGLQDTADGQAESIAQLAESLRQAQAAIDALDEIYATDTALSALGEELRDLIGTAESRFNTAVGEVRSGLAAEAERLTELIDGKADSSALAAQIEAVGKAYQAADALIENAYIAADSALEATLRSAITDAVNGLETTLAGQLSATKEQLQAAIDTKADADTVAEKLSALGDAYAAADAVLKAEIGEELTASLTAAIDSATDGLRAELTALIDGVGSDLGEAVKTLNEAIARKADAAVLEQNIADLTDKYEAADALLRNDFIAADTSLRQELAALINSVEDGLSDAIGEVENQLNVAIENLRAEMNTADETNLKELQSAISTLDAAYKAADTLLEGGLAQLREQDTVFGERIDALETAYKAADDALFAGLQKLQTELEELREDMNGQDAALGEQLDSLASDNNNAASVYRIINITLACAAVLLAVALVVRIVRNRRSDK